MSTSKKYSSTHYQNYLALEEILNSQHLRSAEEEQTPAHDEMLFIIVHQVYELWFKQVLHELESVKQMFLDDQLDEVEISVALHRLNRVHQIQDHMVAQISIIETMTPLDFLEFRNYLFPASGFQSFQFRKMEALLGLKRDIRLTYNKMPYDRVFTEEQRKELKNIEEGTTLLTALNTWLERTPFIKYGDFDFVKSYLKAVDEMMKEDRMIIKNSEYLTEAEKKLRLEMLENTEKYYKSVADQEAHEKKRSEGKVHFTYKAFIAALFINLYRDLPILQMPYRLLRSFLLVDEKFTSWRYRHAQMVMGMLGNKVGTGGSSGHEYLAKTAAKHNLYPDLYYLSTLLIPRESLPELPQELKKLLSFNYSIR